ncbi:MAG: sorbosone dehydrogenase family protein [Gammaproteobacteria bacterium]|nr:sorbosone dehydrogenase family protein [Gammaproteobacteria bacterium]
MSKPIFRRITVAVSLLATAATLAESGGEFKLDVVTDQTPSARQMAEAPSGILFVGSFRAGRVYAVVPVEGAEAEVVTVAEGLTLPSGVVLKGADLYVAALDRVLRYPNIEATYRDRPTPQIVTDALPDETHHGWKYLSVGPDGHLYVPVGAPCNICESADARFASILRMDPDTGETSVYAAGVRNSVGMAWHPETGELWFSDNGRDWLGDDLPPEEINRVQKPGAHYGYPYIHGDDIADPEFGAGHDPKDYVRPEVAIQAHAAALGLAFYTGDQFPAEWQGALFIAEHGSWNRSSKVGYRVSVVRFDDATPRYAPFLDVWLEDEKATARPNDVLVARDGTLLISDDLGGRIFRVTHQPDA